MKIKLSKWGLAENPIGLKVKLPYNGRTLLGDVLGFSRNDVSGHWTLQVRHFNGDMWPIEPVISAVDII